MDTYVLEPSWVEPLPGQRAEGVWRYGGFGVLAYNLHKIGAHLLQERARDSVMQVAA